VARAAMTAREGSAEEEERVRRAVKTRQRWRGLWRTAAAAAVRHDTEESSWRDSNGEGRR
jgi:hypothetical protein